jgi:hypothetical protein
LPDHRSHPCFFPFPCLPLFADIKNGDIEDSPGLDSLHSYAAKLSDDKSKILVTANLKTVESKKGRIPTRDRKTAIKGEEKGGEAAGRENERVVVIGGGSGGVGVIEGLREVSEMA